MEHDWPPNPNAIDALSGDQKWMFGDAGMIYVYFCFHRQLAGAEFESG